MGADYLFPHKKSRLSFYHIWFRLAHKWVDSHSSLRKEQYWGILAIRHRDLPVFLSEIIPTLGGRQEASGEGQAGLETELGNG